MTTLNLALDAATHPQRKPFVRSHTFVDGKGPPPYSFFDETQDHLGALIHAAAGWGWSIDSDEFTEAGARSPDLFGRMRIISTTGTFGSAPVTTILGMGQHGVWYAGGNADPWRAVIVGGGVSLDGDFLLTAKVQLVSREHLDTVSASGFMVAAGTSIARSVCPAFLCGSDSPNWWIRYAPDDPALYDTGIPAVSGRWYRLQISRVAGAIRWFVNGQLVRVNGTEGSYYPNRLLNGHKRIQISRFKPGLTGEGFAIDSFHLLAERSIA